MKEYTVIYKPDRNNWLIVKQTVLAENNADATSRVLAGYVNSQVIAVYPQEPPEFEAVE